MRENGLKRNLAEAPPRFDPRGKELQHWLAALPMANVGETARRLYAALRESNAMELPPRTRLQLLEALHPVLEHVREGLCKHFLGTPFPLPRKAEQVAALSRELGLQMAAGYRVALAGTPRRRVFADRTGAALAAHRAIALMGRTLLPCYQTYAAAPTAFWRILHSLFEDTEARGIAARAVDGGEHGPSRIVDEYKRVLLFALAGPHRLRQDEMASLYSQLGDWAAHTQLQQAPGPAAASECRFVVSAGEDAPPRHWSRGSERGAPAGGRMLDTGALRAELRRLLAAQTGPLVECTSGRRLTRDLLGRVRVSWGAPPRRGFPRTRRDEAVDVVLGLRAAHHVLLADTGGPAADVAFGDSPARYHSATVKSINDAGPDVWDVHFTRPQDAASAPPGTSEPPAPRTHQWRTLNVSPGGWALRLQSDGVRVQVGELVGMRLTEPAAPRGWSAGVVRWIRRRDGSCVELGVELIEREPVALAVRLQRRGGAREPGLQRALLLPGETQAAEASLVVPALLAQEGDAVEAIGPGRGFAARLGPALEHSGGFSRYRFVALTTATDDSAFGELWSEL